MEDIKLTNKSTKSGSEETQEELKENNEKMKSVKEYGNTTMAVPNERIQVLSIIGQIEGHNVSPAQTKATKYEHVIPQLISIEQNKNVKGVLIVLNTVGGDVEAGLAISEMINSISKPTVSIVIGGGHSIGVPLATSSDYSFITPSATMIIHPIRMNGFIIGVIVRTSNIKLEKLEEFMMQTDELLNDVGTILIGKQAVDCGLIDEVGGISKALEKLNELIGDEK